MASSVERVESILASKYGGKSVFFASDIPPYDVIPTGSLAFDYITGVGGFPNNRVVELAGAEGTGKTTLALHTVNNALKKFPKKFCLYIDAEHRLTPSWVDSFVEDSERVIVVAPDHVEQATDMYVEAVSTGECCVAVFDSIGGTASARVTGKSAEVGNVGGNALAVTRFAQFAQTLGSKNSCCTIAINQVRDDMMGYNRLITPGGRALKHAASLRVEVKKGQGKVFEKINGEELQVGYSMMLRVHKNSLAAPGRSTSLWFYNLPSSHGFGIDTVEEISRLSILTGVVEQPALGSYTYKGFPNGKIRGKDKTIEYISTHKEVFDSLKEEVMAQLKKPVQGVASTFDIDNVLDEDSMDVGHDS